MAPAKKSSPSKTPKKVVAKSTPTHPSWTDMIKVYNSRTVSCTPLACFWKLSAFTELCVVVV